MLFAVSGNPGRSISPDDPSNASPVLRENQAQGTFLPFDLGRTLPRLCVGVLSFDVRAAGNAALGELIKD